MQHAGSGGRLVIIPFTGLSFIVSGLSLLVAQKRDSRMADSGVATAGRG